MDKNKYIIVKDRHPKISEVLNDCCTPLCVPANKGESLSSILQKICAKIQAQKITFSSDGNISFEINGQTLTANYTGEIGVQPNNYVPDYVRVVNRSEPGIFNFAHGTVTIGNKMYIGARQSTYNSFVSFNDPSDLTDYTAVYIPGFNSFDSATYDSVNNRIYAIATDDSFTTTFALFSFNPDDVTDYTMLENNTDIPAGTSPGIVTDGTYIYGATWSGATSKFFKYRLSDGNITTNDWTGVTGGHAAAIYEYSDRTELYFSSSDGNFAKVDPTDLSYTSINIGGTLTDDMYFRYINNAGGKVYLGNESEEKGTVVDTATMVATDFDAVYSFGMFSDGTHLYNLGSQGGIQRFKNFDVTSPELFSTDGYVANEFFFVDGKKFFTVWANGVFPGMLIEFEIDDIADELVIADKISSYKLESDFIESTTSTTDMQLFNATQDPDGWNTTTGKIWYDGTKLRVMEGGEIKDMMPTFPVYANNAAAVLAGLPVNSFYRTGDTVKVVH